MKRNEYTGPFSNWAERHAFLVGLTLGVVAGKPPSKTVYILTAYILGRDTTLRQQLETQGHYFLSGFVIGYKLNVGDGEQPAPTQHKGR